MKHLRLFETEALFEVDKANLIKPWVALTKDDMQVHMSNITKEGAKYVYMTFGYALNDIDSAFGIGKNTRLDYADDTYEYSGRTFYKFNISAEIEGQRTTIPDEAMGFVIFANRDFGRLTYPYSVESYFVTEDGVVPLAFLTGGMDIYGFTTEQEGSTIIIEHHDTSSLDKNGADYVDLDLPSGTLWATMNVGATSETEYGDYFMWGSVSPNNTDTCNWPTAPFNNGSSDFDETYFASVSGTVCPNGVLAEEYDVAHMKMGGDWKMPSYSQFAELYNATNNEWVENYNNSGVNGRLFTSTKDLSKSIFIPVAGYRWSDSFRNEGNDARLWSSSLYGGNPSGAWSLRFNSDGVNLGLSSRYYGFSVRGVL